LNYNIHYILYSATIGPVLIKCQAEEGCYYWRESDTGNKRITVTQDQKNATKFSIVCLENANHPNEFAIQKFKNKDETPERLECNIRVDGFSSENSPPVLKQSYAISRDHRLSLKDLEKEQGDTTSPHDWVLGGEWFFIRCARRSREFAIRGKGKLCFKLKEEGQELTVIPSSKSHDGRDVLMLFRTEKPRQEGFEYI
jgi:hypothetical protein